MGVKNEKMECAGGRRWECKQCHEMVGPEETVAYHLVDKILYGWCQSCFNHRGQAVAVRSEMAA